MTDIEVFASLKAAATAAIPALTLLGRYIEDTQAIAGNTDIPPFNYREVTRDLKMALALPLTEEELRADPKIARGYDAGRQITAANLLARIRQVEEPGGSWPATAVADVLAEWFASLGFDIGWRPPV